MVTALKTSATLQKTPAAVTAVTAENLVDIGATGLVAISQVTPGLQVDPVRSQALIFLRGVGSTLTSTNADPAVAVNINGAYVPAEATATGFFDLDRIEVLPGPQGTLYGRNATGGVINIITRRPGSEFETDGIVEVGNYGRLQALVGVDIPLTSDLAVRAAVTWIRHSGYDSNGADDQDTKAARLTAVWKPTDRTKVTGVVTYDQDGGIGQLQFNVPATYGGYRNLGVDARGLGLNQNFHTFIASIDATHELNDHFSLEYVGGYTDLSQYVKATAWDGPPAAYITNIQGNDTITQELRLNGTFNRLTTITGLYYFHSRYSSSAYVNNQGVETDTGPWVGTSGGWAAFGQATYALTDWLRLTGGLRDSQTNKWIDGINTTIQNNVTTVATYIGTKDQNHLDWKGAFELDLGPRSMLYGSVSTGFTPGGLSTAPVSLSSTAAQTFEPSILTSYEAGVKNRFLDGRITFNVEGFYYDYKNYQVSARDPATALNIVYDAAKARLYGVQVDTRFLITPRDDLSLGFVVESAKAITLITPSCNCSGYDLPHVPDLTYTMSYRHTFDLGNMGTLDGLVQGQGSSSWWGLYTHANGTFVHPTHTVDLTATYRPVDSKLSYSVWARNVGNDIVPLYVGTSPPPSGPGALFLAAPRTYGVRVSFAY